MRWWVLTLSLWFCRIALADDGQVPRRLVDAPRPVSMEVVDQVVEASDRAVQACNRSARRLDTLAVLVHLTIDGDGTVTAAEVAPRAGDQAKAPEEAACLVRVARKLKFPATGAVSHVLYPFMLVSRVRRALTF